MDAMISVDTYRIDRRVAGVSLHEALQLHCESPLALVQCCGQTRAFL